MAQKTPKAKAAVDALRGAFDRAFGPGPVRARAAIASLIWTVVVGAYALGFFGASQARGTVFLDGAYFLVTLVLPIILVWLAAFLAEELLRLRAAIARLADVAAPLFGALDASRAWPDRNGAASPAAVADAMRAGSAADVAAQLERVAAGQEALEAVLQSLLRHGATGSAPAVEKPRPRTRPRATPPPDPPPAAQPDLPMLAEPDPEARLEWDDLMRALDFPRDADDREGFRALRLALRHHSLAQMLQAAEDVLTLLSQEGLYMDDLDCDPADPKAWRRFVAGARGIDAAGVGGVGDAAALEAARSLMKADQIFRDTALFFQRRFDGVLAEIAADASDDELAQLANTRSARAFQLMARASGSFD